MPWSICILIFCSGLLSNVIVYAQSGFFMTVTCSKSISSQRKVLTDKQTFCLTDNPIVDISGVVHVGELYEAKNPHLLFFDILMSDDGYKVLKNISIKVPSARLVLMNDDAVVFVFDPKKNELFQSIRIHRSTDLIFFTLLHQKLKHAASTVEVEEEVIDH